MPLQFIEETSGNAYIRFMVRDDEWVMSSPTGMIPCEMESSPVVVDIENIVLGWLKLEGGRDWHPWPNNDPSVNKRPSDAHDQGFSVKFYSTKIFDDEPVRELSAAGKGILQFVRDLHDEAEKAKEFGNGKVPVVKIDGSKKVKMGKNDTRVPNFEIVKWINRPENLAGDLAPPADDDASSSSPANSQSGGAPNVDFDNEV
tara:strand:+ start:2888 stop:3490 length:603 start_codon:yes stop_codon:yes gene_type:complete